MEWQCVATTAHVNLKCALTNFQFSQLMKTLWKYESEEEHTHTHNKQQTNK